ncbi:unnamed protein product, partial [Iphiclides podalirius]
MEVQLLLPTQSAIDRNMQQATTQIGSAASTAISESLSAIQKSLEEQSTLEALTTWLVEKLIERQQKGLMAVIQSWTGSLLSPR